MHVRFDLQTLKLFTTAVETRNLAQTAEREHIAASALSKRISDLEATVRTKLFHRLRRGIEPTPAGLALYPHAQEILRGLERAAADLIDYQKGIRGHVTVCANISSILQFLPQDLASFSRRHPDIRVAVREASTPAVLRSVAEGQADIGVGVCSLVAHKLHTSPYHRDRMVLIVPAKHPLIKRKSMIFAEALDYDIVGLHAENVWTSYVTTAARKVAKPLRMRINVPSVDAIVRMVEAGHGISVVPQACVERDLGYGRIKAVALDDDWAQRRIELFTRDPGTLSAAAELLRAHLSAVGGRSTPDRPVRRRRAAKPSTSRRRVG